MVVLKPYVGITGFMNRQEVDAVIQSLEAEDDRQWLMIGVLASEKSLAGTPNKFPNRYPNPQTIKDIFPEDSSILRLVHFSTQAVGAEFLHQMHHLRAIAGPNCDGFQLNVKWPSVDILEMYKLVYPNDTLVLQCGAGAMKSVGSESEKLADKIAEYENITDYALIDPSGGYGKAMDTSFTLETLRRLEESGIDMNFVVAGGLNGDTLETIRDIVKEFPDVSTDAEGGLRDEEDHLDILKAGRYYSVAMKLYGR